MTECVTIFYTPSDELLKEAGLKWLTVRLPRGAYVTEKHFVIQDIYTGLLSPTVRYLFLYMYSQQFMRCLD